MENSDAVPFQILIVDDMEPQIKLLEKTLIRLGYTVAGTARTGAEAVEKALSLQPDLILMDIVMPGDIDGVEAAREIRKTLEVPVVFTTSHSSDEYLSRALEITPYAYMLKPIEAEQLHVTIETIRSRVLLEEQLFLAHESLRQSERRFRTLVNNMPVGLFRATPGRSARFITANPALMELLGYEDLDQLVAARYEDFFQNPQEFDAVADRLTKEGRIQKQQICFKRSPGTVFWAEVTTYVVRDEEGNIKYVEGLVQDITEETSMKTELNEVYHNLSDQTNLQDRLDCALEERAMARENAALLMDALDKDIEPALRDFINIAVNQDEFDAVPFTEVAAEAAQQAGVAAEIGDGDVSLFGDKSQLTRALACLMRAAAALPGSQGATVGVRKDTAGDVVCVSAPGATVNEEDNSAIFALLEGGGVKEALGTPALADLATARRILRLHCGILWIEATGENPPAFCFTL